MDADHRRKMTRRFFEFMTKRELLRLKKLSGAPWPWSDDSILNIYKFTNVKREHDRTTKWMRDNWTGPNESRPPGEIVFNCALFRYFGTIEFARAIGWQSSWVPSDVAHIAENRLRSGNRVFTGAYIIPTLGLRGPKSQTVCQEILTPLWSAKDEIARVAIVTQSWKQTAERMMQLAGFGGTGFMTKEVLQDVMQTPVLRDSMDRNTWCPAGPGAQRGLNRVAGRKVRAKVGSDVALREMVTLFKAARRTMPDFMPTLELHDIQFQLCEFDKYERVLLNEGRPKVKYKPTILERYSK